MIISILFIAGLVGIAGIMSVPEDQGTKIREEAFRRHYLEIYY